MAERSGVKIGGCTLPKLIEVVERPGSFSLRIDGVEFPYFISDDGIQTQVSRDTYPRVTITLIADEVRIVHAIVAEKAEAL